MKFLILFSILFSFNLKSAELVFKKEGEATFTVSLDQLRSKKIEAPHGTLRASDVKIFNVFRGYERVYEGYDLFDLLDAVYGKDWRKAKRISFSALDGYSQVASISKMLAAAKSKNGLLAFSEKGKNGFTPFEKENKKIDLGPLYLVWTNFTEEDKASHADILKWPYQLTLINIE